eukprot:m.283609 g.283609  ORF g.283609 m.283609 type:complete len:1494 (+) comp40671_c0_seq45:1484-5965(+)
MLFSFRRKKHNQVRDVFTEEAPVISPLAKSLDLSTESFRTNPRGGSTGVASLKATTPAGSFSSPSAHLSSLYGSIGSLAGSSASVTSLDVFDEPPKAMKGLRQDVERFSQAVNHLRTALSSQPSCGFQERGIDTGPAAGVDEKRNLRERVEDRIRWLGEVKNIVICVLNSHRSIHSTGIVSSLGSLMSKLIDDCEEEGSSEKLLDSLENAFCASISEYMQTEGNESKFLTVPGLSRESSMESLLSESKENLADTPFSPARSVRTTALSVDPNETAQMLIKMETGMDITFEHAKVWSRFLKEIMSYYEKRAQYKLDYASRTIKLTRSMRDVVTEIDGLGLPYFSSITLGLEQDLTLYRKWHDAFKTQLAARVLEPLSQHREDHEKQRKLLKDAWIRHQKKLAEAVGLLKKTKAKYNQLCEECNKVANKLALLEKEEAPLSKLEKRSKQEEDLKTKARDAEAAYRSSVEEANHALENLESFKAKKLKQMCQAFHSHEQYVRKILLDYIEVEQDASSDISSFRDILIDDFSSYTLGSQFFALVKSFYDDCKSTENYSEPQHLRFEFKPYQRQSSVLKKSLSAEDLIRAEHDFISRSNTETMNATSRNLFLSPTRRVGLKTSIVAKLNHLMTGGSGSASKDGGEDHSTETKKGYSLPESKSPPMLRHPGPGLRKRPSSIAGQSLDEVRGAGDKSPGHSRNLKNVLKMMKEPFKAKENDALLAAAAAADKRRPLVRRPTFFGVDLARQCRMTGRSIPLLVQKCIAELDGRALTTHGLYRVSAAQTKCRELCRAFEAEAKSVDLSEMPPHLIASVLKYYLRQLPQPLLTYRLYSSFIAVAKKWQSTQLNALRNSHESVTSPRHPPSLGKTKRSVSLEHRTSLVASPLPMLSQESEGVTVPRSTSQSSLISAAGGQRKTSIIDGEQDEVLEDLQKVVEQLPRAFYSTAAALFHHLYRVASFESDNSMSASNLAIVFGPNILKPRENESTTFSTLVDMQHQLRAVELLIRFPEVLDEKSIESCESKTQEMTQDDSTDEEVTSADHPRSVRGEIMISPPSAPSTPPTRKRQSMTELEDLYAALTNANKDRLQGQRSRLSGDFTEEEALASAENLVVPISQAAVIASGGDTSEEGSYEGLLPGSVAEDDHISSRSTLGSRSPSRSLDRLISPARLSPLGPSLYEQFDLDIRPAIQESSSGSKLEMLMQEAAKTAASTDYAAKRLSDRKQATGRFEEDILAEMEGSYSESDDCDGDDDDDDDEEAIIDLLITDAPRSPPPSAAVVVQEMSGRHTSTLIEHVGAETSEMTVWHRDDKSPSPTRTRSVIDGLMKEFDREILALNTPPDSPRLAGRRKVVRRAKGKGKAASAAAAATSEQPTAVSPVTDQTDSAAQSLDSLLSVAEESSPLSWQNAQLSGTPSGKVSSDSLGEKGHIQVKTGWRRSGADKDDAKVPIEQNADGVQRDSGISLIGSHSDLRNGAAPGHGDDGSFLSVAKKKSREPRFV